MRKSMLALRFPLLLLLLLYETIWLVYLAPTDVTRYQCYATAFWYGSRATTLLPAAQCAFLQLSSLQPAFHLLPVEYPPLTILLFSVPLIAPLPYYGLAFALFMLLMAGLIHRLLARFHSLNAARFFLLSLCFGATFLVQVRFDLVPAACMLLCLIAAERKHWRLAYSALAVGVLLKLYPFIALPALFIAEQKTKGTLLVSSDISLAEGRLHWRQRFQPALQWRWKNISLFTGILLGVTGCFALLDPQAAIIGPLSYFIQRPTQVESMDSGVLWLAQLVGTPIHIVYSYGSYNIESPLTAVISGIGLVVCICGFLFTVYLQWTQKLSLGQAMIALLCLLITTGKVFSPQYLMWLIPLIAYVGASRLWLSAWIVVMLLTAGIYLFYYPHLTNPAGAPQIINHLPGFFEIIMLRNMLFFMTTLAYLFDWFQARQSDASHRDRESKQLSPGMSAAWFGEK